MAYRGYTSYQPPSEGTGTEYNSNQLSIMRLSKLLEDCNEYSRLSYFNGYNVEYLKLWKNTIKDFEKELLPKITKENRLIIYNLFLKANKIGKIFEIKNTPEGKVSILNPMRFNKHWNLLHYIESKLRLLADEKGMLMTNFQGGGDAISDDE